MSPAAAAPLAGDIGPPAAGARAAGAFAGTSIPPRTVISSPLPVSRSVMPSCSPSGAFIAPDAGRAAAALPGAEDGAPGAADDAPPPGAGRAAMSSGGTSRPAFLYVLITP